MTKKNLPAPVTPAPTAATIREELRVLTGEDEQTQKEWITPEFVSMVSSVAINLITAATVVGWVDGNSAQELTKAVTAIGTAVGVLGANAAIVWKYLASRQAVKTEAVRAKYRYMEAVAVERLSSNSGW
jgi:hypothetical protein